MAAIEKKLTSSLYVGDLHPDVTEKDLTEKFSSIGPLLSVHLCLNKFTRRSLCYGYVNFWLPCHAFAALKCLNHTVFKGNRIRIMWYERNPTAKKDNNNGNLFVKNLNKSITSPLLQKIFSRYGTILSCKVVYESGISKGFGFVQFESDDSAIAARSALHDTLLAGKKLYVSRFLRKNERNGAEVGFRSLYVKNLDEDITADTLKAKFSQYGKVSSASIMKDEKGKSKGFGFVNFYSHEAAKRAMDFLNGEMLGLKNMIVARAMKKSELRKNLTNYGDQLKKSKSSNIFANNHNGSACEELFCGQFGVNSVQSILNCEISRRFSYAPFLCPYDTKNAFLNPLTAWKKEQEATKLHKLSENLASDPFYASKFSHWSYPIPLKQQSPSHPTQHQYFANPYIASYPVTTQYTHGSFDACPNEVAAVNGQALNECIQGRYLKTEKEDLIAKRS